MALDMTKKSEMDKSMIFSDSLSSLVAIKEGNQNYPYIQEILETSLSNKLWQNSGFLHGLLAMWALTAIKWLTHLQKKQLK